MPAPAEPTASVATASPPRPTAFFLQAPGRRLGPLTRGELAGYLGAGLVGADAMIIGPDWDGAVTADAAAEWFGVTRPAPAPAPVAPAPVAAPAPIAPRDPATLPPLPEAPIAYRRAGPGWRVVAAWLVALLAVQMAIVPGLGSGAPPLPGDFVVAVAWRFALVAAACFVVIGGLVRLARGLWPSAGGPLLAMSAVYAVLVAQFVLQPRAAETAVATAAPVVATPAPTAGQEDPTGTWARQQFAAFEARASADRAAAALPAAPSPDAAAGTAAPAVETSVAAPAPVVPVDPDPWHTRAFALHNERNWQALLAHATDWTAAQPNRFQSWQYLGIAQFELNQREAAVASFERALAAGSRDPSTMRALAGAYLGTHRLHEAADMSQRILADDPGSVYALVILGKSMAALGEYDEAVDAIERAIKLRPRERYYYGLLADIHFQFHQLSRGNAAIEAANDLL
jgi:cytochrome c-type biogenesis protein CcmH/NrfG